MVRINEGVLARLALPVAIAWVTAGCAAPATDRRAERIWDVHAGAFVTERALIERLAAAPVVLLGELHDSAEHHALQARALRSLAGRGRRPALVMEQFDVEHQAALEAGRRAVSQRPAADRTADAEAIADAGRFDRRGWQWPFYRPLVEIALGFDLPIVAANASGATLRAVMQRGFDALGAGRPSALGLPPAMSDAQTATVTRAIVEGHCGLLPEARAGSMVRAQQARDAVMAEAVAMAARSTGDGAPRGAVLIAGNGHVRRDVGVPFYLDAVHRVAAVAVGFVESPDPDAPAREQLEGARGQYDYLWITRARERTDPCIELRERFKPGTRPAAG